jgi:hypothetical protein
MKPLPLSRFIRHAAFLAVLGVCQAHAGLIVSLVGDKDQNPPPHPDGFGIVHEPEDLPGFDQRLVGGTYSWTHAFAAGLVTPGSTAVLDLAVVGFIDGNYPGIDNRLFVHATEVAGAFDNSLDGWRLYSFAVPLSYLTTGTLNVTLVVSPLEGWGGVDYAELRITTPGGEGVPDGGTSLLLLGAGLVGLALLHLLRKRR